MKYLKLFENFNDDLDIYDAKQIVITHLGEIKEIDITKYVTNNDLLKFELREKPTEDQIESCREHLFPEYEEKGFFLDIQYNFSIMKIFIVVGVGNSLEEYCIKWLNEKFGNLKKVDSVKKINYVDDNNNIIFMYYKIIESGDNYLINNDLVWSFLYSILGNNFNKTQDLISTWLEEKYELTELVPFSWIPPPQ
jgi:hypothetical protein